ncbi:MAG: protease modulator HflC [Deltaproteobacteria bacterium]|nr:protease modulator HflC [Deltaproteobacteria bacterium]
MKSLKLLGPVVVVLLILGSSSFFTVQAGFQAILTQFGKPVGEPYTEAGLYFKLPLIQEVHTFEKRLLKWDGSPNQIPTRDKKYIWVDTTARWRIKDPLKYLQTVSTERAALSRLDDILDSVVRDQVSSSLLVELVRSMDWEPHTRDQLGLETLPEVVPGGEPQESDDTPRVIKQGRQLITRRMLAEAGKVTPQYGIELVDIRIKRINYVESVQKRVFERMVSERKRIASQFRSEGEGDKRRILGQMQKELAAIRSRAYKRAQEIRGVADGKVTTIFGQAYGQDPDFYALFKTLETYGQAGAGKTDILLSTDNYYYQYLKKP